AQLLEACASRSLPAALAEVEKLETEGIPLIPFFDDCISCIREQLLASETGDVLFSPAELSDMALLFMERRRDAKQGIDPRFAFELAVTPVALGLLPNASTTGASPRNTGANPVAIARVEPVPSNGTSTPEGISLAEVRRAWPKILQQVSEQNASLSFILTNARPERVEGNTMTIRFKFPFHKEKILEQPKNRQAVMAALERVLGIASLRLEGIVGTSDEAAVRSPTDAVSRFIHIFDGQMIDEAAES
ncbi:hypothetical protein HY479_01830, partial [Candidatus Uhrbacteria bacterium]|nr:hypothetical protein [Candidatus Uhrbacteria bacterium]